MRKVSDYVLERRLDPGGHHEVWLARRGDGRAVAVKLGGSPQPADGENELIPGLVPVLESGLSDGVAYQVMPLVPGITLSDRLAEGPLLANEAERVVASVTHTVVALHAAGRTHGDIRSANVVLGRDGEVTLIDREQRDWAAPHSDRAALALLLLGSGRASPSA